jgi:hypothetical protein
MGLAPSGSCTVPLGIAVVLQIRMELGYELPAPGIGNQVYFPNRGFHPYRHMTFLIADGGAANTGLKK